MPATLALTLGAPGDVRRFHPGRRTDLHRVDAATVISSAGDATLTVSDPSTVAPGHLVNGAFALPTALQAKAASAAGTAAITRRWAARRCRSSCSATRPGEQRRGVDRLKQSVGAAGRRTGTYSKTLTFTLSTTAP